MGKRILLAWELGANYGHVVIMRLLAQLLKARGHECFFAVRELRAAEEYITPDLGPVFAAPRSPQTARNPVKVQINYASLLHNTGFDDAVELAGRLRAWQDLMKALRIDLLLANHAPSAVIAARCLGLPRSSFGSSFTMPPVVSPFPVFQPQMQVAESILRHNENEVLRTMNQALVRLGFGPMGTLDQIFEGCHTGIFGYRELDTYDPALRPPGSHLGIADQAHGETPVWQEYPGPRVFAYVRPFSYLPSLMKALQASSLNVLLRVADLEPGQLREFQRPGLAITASSVNMRQAAEACDAMIHYAPDGSTTEMLLAGKPGLLFPLDVEKVLLSWRAQQLGAVLVSASQQADRVGQLLERLVEDEQLRRGAETFAARYRHQDRSTILPAYVGEALALL